MRQCGARQLWSPRHDLFGCFDLCRNRSFVRGGNGMDHASLDPMALLAQKPKRPTLHRRRRSTACERGNWGRGRFPNRGSTWLCEVGARKIARLGWRLGERVQATEPRLK